MSENPQSVTYKESGIPWVGKIPEHWEILPLQAVFQNRSENNSDKRIGLILSLVKDLGIIPYEEKGDIGNKSKDDLSQYKIARENDIVLNKMNAVIGSIGISKYVGLVSPIYLVLAIRNHELFSPLYFSRMFEIKALQESLSQYASGIMKIRESIDYLDFKKMHILVPPIQEQQAIADFLDKKTRQIEEFITKKQKLITLLEEKKQTLINQCVTQGLDSSTPLKDSGVEWLGKIPTHWEVKKLKYVVSLRNQKEGESDFRIGLENIESKTGRFIQADESAFDDEGIGFFEGDVLFGKLRPYLAKVFLADRNGICVSEFLVLKSEKIFNRFLKFLMLSGAFIDVVNGSTYGTKMPRANWEFIGNLKIPLPPLEEQKAIAEYLDTQIEKIDCVIFKIKSQINLIKEYKSTLISEAVCGRTGIKQ